MNQPGALELVHRVATRTAHLARPPAAARICTFCIALRFELECASSCDRLLPVPEPPPVRLLLRLAVLIRGRRHDHRGRDVVAVVIRGAGICVGQEEAG